MSLSVTPPQSCGNRLLALLSADEYNDLVSQLELIELKFKQVIGERNNPIPYIYFPCTAVMSVLNHMLDGGTAEVGTIGNEGFYGVDILVGVDFALEMTLCQIEGTALRMRTADFRHAIEGNTALRRLTQRYLAAYMSQISQSVACNRLHAIEARFARWVLMTYDRVQGEDFYLTQEFLANMLGVHRPTVSLVAGAFQLAGMIRYNRGRMTILNRDMLEESCCECYAIVNEQYERTVGVVPSKNK